jgi:hypothetical protein
LHLLREQSDFSPFTPACRQAGFRAGVKKGEKSGFILICPDRIKKPAKISNYL